MPRVLSPRGTRTYVLRNAPLDSWVHVSVLCSLTKPGLPLVLHLQREINTGLTFARLVMQLVLNGYLVAGDVFIVDRAAIHFSQPFDEPLTAFLDQHGVLFISFFP